MGSRLQGTLGHRDEAESSGELLVNVLLSSTSSHVDTLMGSRLQSTLGHRDETESSGSRGRGSSGSLLSSLLVSVDLESTLHTGSGDLCEDTSSSLELLVNVRLSSTGSHVDTLVGSRLQGTLGHRDETESSGSRGSSGSLLSGLLVGVDL